ncbi:hypothetical protein HETIRDRAFT_431365 [Heterobasidion irregulare TC 32-1]|uniref:Rab-GAP TBC domain-containing protein n=1 Tax=Heterobasidion irregulare (strain TC 32-1) TaxID=747525 RepID=W4KPT8_HETIT|nr:uncharacterized protein HETIRDRAFT_431365 [Heterobasidion irregulare TC 32-1]ETW87843.1 hypothetical protein HETIRDRAFT_431365 [Heterobasidion irregulare TC 32-1]
MDAPHLVLVPPSPRYPTSSSPSPPPSTVRTAPPTPELTYSSIDQERSSSETIVSIYSMYGDESNSLSPDIPSKGVSASLDRYSVYRDSPRSTSHNSHEGSAYYSATSDNHHASRRSTPVHRASAATTTWSAGSRSSSGETGSPYLGINVPDEGPPRQRGSRYRHNSTHSSKHISLDEESKPLPAHPRHLVPSTPHSRSPSHSHSSLPNGNASHQQRSSVHTSPQPTAQRHISTASLTSAPSTSASPSSPVLSKKNSKLSIARSEGEDPDSFHVRSTYARLDVFGVKGDGYEEGIERTRARVGPNRASEILAANAVGDEAEKKRELTSQEIEMLAGLDRYGFITAPSHDRLVLLPATAFTKPFARIANPVVNGTPNPTILKSIPPPPPPTHEVARMEKWGRMLEPRSRDRGGNIETWGLRAPKEHKLSRRTYKGIPDRWRSAAWQLLMSRFSQTGKEELRALEDEYLQALEYPSSYDIQIDLDVPRTISGHVLFRTRYGLGQRSLFHVLHSFSLRCSECGYCQGMGPIASMLLCYFEPERAYASLVQLHDKYRMHTIFSPGFPGLLESIFVQERLIQEMMPNVYAAFKTHTISTTSYATKWYITLFANSVPFQTLLRLWDVFLLEGPDLFVVVAISIIWTYRDHITSSQASFETILSLLSSFFVPEDENGMMLWISKVLEVQKLRSDIRSWREEWKGLVASGRDGQALL